jgi:hypothetical protein
VLDYTWIASVECRKPVWAFPVPKIQAPRDKGLKLAIPDHGRCWRSRRGGPIGVSEKLRLECFMSLPRSIQQIGKLCV